MISRTIKEMPFDMRPYEKCEKYGEAALSDTELLAVILRNGSKGKSSLKIASEILTACPYRQGLIGIYNLSVEQLKEIDGIGTVKAMQIRCLGELSKRLASKRAFRNQKIQSPASVAEYYMEKLKCEEKEKVFCMMLDTKNALIKDVVVSVGTVNASLISVREILTKALEFHAVSIVLVHNHPSGDPTPSSEDLDVTTKLKEACELIGIRLMDHIIIGQKRFTSILSGSECCI